MKRIKCIYIILILPVILDSCCSFVKCDECDNPGISISFNQDVLNDGFTVAEIESMVLIKKSVLNMSSIDTIDCFKNALMNDGICTIYLEIGDSKYDYIITNESKTTFEISNIYTYYDYRNTSHCCPCGEFLKMSFERNGRLIVTNEFNYTLILSKA